MTWGIGGKFMIALVAAEYGRSALTLSHPSFNRISSHRTLVFCLGFALRFGVHSDLHGRGIYIAEYLLIILAPCGFIAADYVFLGRLCRVLNCDKHLLIRPQRIILFFVASDVATFLVQVSFKISRFIQCLTPSVVDYRQEADLFQYPLIPVPQRQAFEYVSFQFEVMCVVS